MKKILLLTLCCIIGFSSSAETENNNDYYYMPIEVKFYDNWYKGYPVITGDYGLNFIEHFAFPDIAESLAFINNSNYLLYCAISKINDEPTKDKNPSEIIKMCMDSPTDTLHLELCKKIAGTNHFFLLDLVPGNNVNPPFDIKATQSVLSSKIPRAYPEGIRVFSLPGVDFAQYNTYDFLITSNDPLEDLAILEEFVDVSSNTKFFSGMVRDEQSPDLIITIAKNADESISSTYVPPTSQVVQTGSTTTPVYNFITHKHDWITKNRTRVHQTEGYTQTTKTQNVYLEISVLDTKRMLQEGQSTPPIVWQMKYSNTFTDSSMQMSDIYKTVADWAPYPFKSCPWEQRLYLNDEYKPTVIWDDNSVITKVLDNYGNEDFLQEGDRIIAINGKKELTIKPMATFNRGNKIYEIKGKYRIDEPSGLTKAVQEFLFYAEGCCYSGIKPTQNITEYGDLVYMTEWQITNNFGGKRTFTVLRNGKKKKVKGVLFPLDEIRDYADPDKSDYEKYFHISTEGI